MLLNNKTLNSLTFERLPEVENPKFDDFSTLLQSAGNVLGN